MNSPTQTDRAPTTLEKALDINTNPLIYGSFAEIGAGQEVARQFFLAGKASQTIALTISAYDMTFSDTIYGKEKSGRYVCQSRLQKMLDHEFQKLIDRLGNIRGSKTCFFAFADTVATASEGSGKTSHGWLGVRFQTSPESETSEVYIHVRLLDRSRLNQQESLGKLGVNLVHACFYHHSDSQKFLEGLFDQIKDNSIIVDGLHFKGPAFKNYDEIFLNLKLIEMDWSDAIIVNPQGQVENPSDALWGKNIFIQRGFYSPVTQTHLDIAQRGTAHFSKEFQITKNQVFTVFEFTLNNRFKDQRLSAEQALHRVNMLKALKIPVMVTRFSYFYELKKFIRQFNDKHLGIVVGAAHLNKLFDQTFYSDLEGGLLEGMGKLLDQVTRLYIYPHKTKEVCLLTKSFFPDPKVAHVYRHFIENNMIQDIAGCEEIAEFVHSQDILKMIKTKNPEWKKHVPPELHESILRNIDLLDKA